MTSKRCVICGYNCDSRGNQKGYGDNNHLVVHKDNGTVDTVAINSPYYLYTNTILLDLYNRWKATEQNQPDCSNPQTNCECMSLTVNEHNSNDNIHNNNNDNINVLNMNFGVFDFRNTLFWILKKVYQVPTELPDNDALANTLQMAKEKHGAESWNNMYLVMDLYASSHGDCYMYRSNDHFIYGDMDIVMTRIESSCLGFQQVLIKIIQFVKDHSIWCDQYHILHKDGKGVDLLQAWYDFSINKRYCCVIMKVKERTKII